MKTFTKEELEKKHTEAKKHYEDAQSYWSDIYERMWNDLEFASGQQWVTDIITSRKDRPCVVLNQIQPFINRIVNQFKSDNPEISISGQDPGADVSKATLLQGWTRYIEQKSKASMIYSHAMELSTTCGIGYFRIVNEYESKKSFNQDVRIESIETPFSVYPDPEFKEIDGSDMQFCFVIEDVNKDQFIKEYGEDENIPFDMVDFIQNPWYPEKNTVRIAEYFWKEEEIENYLQLSDGTQIFESDMIEDEKDEDGNDVLKQQFANLQIISKKKACKTHIYWLKMNGEKVLDSTEIPGEYIPVVPVIGIKDFHDRKRNFCGITTSLMDAQKTYNYYASVESEMVQNAPKSPWIIAAGQIGTYSKFWDNANKESFSYLPYDPISVGGTQVPPPQRTDNTAQIQYLIEGRNKTLEDMKSITGIYDAALGNSSQETSGKAVLLKSKSSDTLSMGFAYNAKLSIVQGGKILLSMFSKVINKTRMIKILSPNQQVLQQLVDPALYDQDLSDLAIIIGTAKGYDTRRAEEADRLMQVMQVIPPQQSANITDLLIQNLDLSDADEIQRRIQATIPPQILGKAGDPQSTAMIQQQHQLIEQQQQQLAELQKKIDDKQAELTTKVEIERLKVMGSLAEQELKDHTQLLMAGINPMLPHGDQTAIAEVDQIMAGIDAHLASQQPQIMGGNPQGSNIQGQTPPGLSSQPSQVMGQTPQEFTHPNIVSGNPNEVPIAPEPQQNIKLNPSNLQHL